MAAASSIGTVVLDLMAGDATVEASVVDRKGDTAATMSVDTALLKNCGRQRGRGTSDHGFRCNRSTGSV